MTTTYSAWLRWRACDRKRPLAWLEANTRVLEAWKIGDGSMTAYPCPHAGDDPHWHVGHDRERGAA